MTLSVSEWQLLQDLKHRMEVVERTLADHNLREHNAGKALKAARLREAIGQVLETSTQPYRLTAKHVIRALDLDALGCPNVSLRTIREHMRSIRHGGTLVQP